MDKSFICLVSCKPYDDLKAVVNGIRVLKNEDKSGLRIDPYLALMDFDQISDEDRGSFSEITLGTSVQPFSMSSLFAKDVEAEILKDKKVQFVFVGEEESNGAVNNTEAIGDKIRSSIFAGLPVILGLNVHDNADQLKEKLQRYLSDLSDEQREAVTLVYQSSSLSPLRLELDAVQDALSKCRAILEDVFGEPLAERMKILYSISKFTPELLKKCLIDQIDGVCIRPSTLPVREKTAEINTSKIHMTEPEPKVDLQREKKPVNDPTEEVSKQEEEKKTRDIDSSGFLAENNRKEECLIFCHSYDDVEKTIEKLKELAKEAGRSDQTKWLFALPFSLTSEIASIPQVSCGSWNLSFANTKLLTEDIHLSILKERGASFVVLGDRMGRAHLNISDKEINRLIRKVLENDLSVVIGLTHQDDYREQLQNLLEGIEPENLQSVRFLFYAGLLGQSFDHEAAEIAASMQGLHDAVHSLYGEESFGMIKILIEVSHFSEDPFAYLSHRSVDGISLSASAIKSELVRKLTRKISREKKTEPVIETAFDEPEAPEAAEMHVVSEFEQEESAAEEEDEKEEEKKTAVKDVEDVEKKVLEAPVAAVKEFAAADTSMTEEEMEEWEKSHPDGGTQRSVEVEFVESEERREEVAEEEESDEIAEPVEEAAVGPVKNAATVAEGLQLVKLTVDECAERLAEKNFQETYIPNDMELESYEVKLERLKREYKRMFDDFRDRSSEGWEVLFRELKEKNHPQRESIVKALNLPLEKIMKFTEINEVVEEEGKAWFEVIGLSKDQMNALYEVAKGLYEKKKYTESAEAFFTLVSLNAKEYGMWFGYGMAKKMENKDLETALNAFSMANSLNATKPDSYIHAAECYLAQGNASEAERCLMHGKKLITADAEHAAMKEWADYLTNQLKGGHR